MVLHEHVGVRMSEHHPRPSPPLEGEGEKHSRFLSDTHTIGSSQHMCAALPFRPP